MLNQLLKQDPDHIAYRIGHRHITYGALSAQAAHYGQLLRRQGSGPVLIYGHKDIEVLVAIFACLHARRAYIPVDLFTPAPRLQQIIACADPALVLTEQPFPLPQIPTASLGDLERYQELPCVPSSNETAYIIFTSGSTGSPKGVPIPYSCLSNFIRWISRLLDYQGITVLNQASFSFDLSVADIFYSLCNGHTLIGLDKAAQDSFDGIFDAIRQSDLMVATPTFLKLCLLNKEFDAAHFPSLRCLFLCGEQLEPSTAGSLLERFPQIRLLNAYGPTEATCAVSASSITADMLSGPLLPCGDIADAATEIRVVDDEIILKGQSVFGGYLAGIPGGFYEEGATRCFKTGDLGYIRDGQLYCRGRKDSQIKYMGYRIELPDIESNLYQVQGVRQCAVVAKYRDNCVRMIKAYVVLEDGCTAEQVREALKERLPSYMIPRVIKALDALPVNANGKIDRKRLMGS